MLSIPNRFKFYSEPGGSERYELILENFPIELDRFPESYFKKIFIDNFTLVQEKYMTLNPNFMDLDNLFSNESLDNPFLVKFRNVLGGNIKIVDINLLLTDNDPLIGRFYRRCDLIISIKQYINEKKKEKGGYLVARLSSNAFGCRTKKNQQVWNKFMKDCKIALGNVLNQILKTEQVNLLGYEQFSRFALDKGLQTTNLPIIGSFLGPTEFNVGKEAVYNKSTTNFLSRDPSRKPETFMNLDVLNLNLRRKRSRSRDLNIDIEDDTIQESSDSEKKIKLELQGGIVHLQRKKKSKNSKKKSLKRSKRSKRY